MNTPASKLEKYRQDGKYHVDAQRASILDAAERLFLQKGLENTQMIEIAAQAGITKMSLYRYYPNRDVIALEIHERAMTKIASMLPPAVQELSMETIKILVHRMIHNFFELRDVYRLMGMFDQRYLDHTADAPLTHWAKTQLASFKWKGYDPAEMVKEKNLQYNRIIMIINAVIWFLEKLALRGEMTWSDQSVPLEDQLKLYEEMITVYVDHCIENL